MKIIELKLGRRNIWKGENGLLRWGSTCLYRRNRDCQSTIYLPIMWIVWKDWTFALCLSWISKYELCSVSKRAIVTEHLCDFDSLTSLMSRASSQQHLTSCLRRSERVIDRHIDMSVSGRNNKEPKGIVCIIIQIVWLSYESYAVCAGWARPYWESSIWLRERS